MNQKEIWDNIALDWHKFRTEKLGVHTKEFLKDKTGKILDLGSGSGRYLSKNKNMKMYLVDFSPEMIKLAKDKAKKQKIDAEFFISELSNLPFKDNFFDSAIVSSSLHCVEKEKDRKKTIKELYRVLKKGGEAEISVWNKDSDRFKNSPKERFVKWLDKGERYYYLYSKEEIYKSFEKEGFKIIYKEDPKMMIVFIVKK